MAHFVSKHWIGCTNDSGALVERDPDTVRGVDVTFYDDAQNADDMERKYAVEPPLLAVEVMSPGDRINRTLVRVTQLLNVGVRQVWVIDPQARDVSIYRPGQSLEIVKSDGELAAGDILPEFLCHISDFFGAPGSI